MAGKTATAAQLQQRAGLMLAHQERVSNSMAQLTHDVAALDRAVLGDESVRLVAIKITAAFLTASVLLEHLSTLMVDVWNELEV